MFFPRLISCIRQPTTLLVTLSILTMPAAFSCSRPPVMPNIPTGFLTRQAHLPGNIRGIVVEDMHQPREVDLPGFSAGSPDLARRARFFDKIPKRFSAQEFSLQENGHAGNLPTRIVPIHFPDEKDGDEIDYVIDKTRRHA